MNASGSYDNITILIMCKENTYDKAYGFLDYDTVNFEVY